MLIDDLTNFCNTSFRNSQCQQCNHAAVCPGDCGKCLDQIHFPKSSTDKKYYDCPQIINYYVCRYTHKYSSEILYLLYNSKILAELDTYRVLSAGCGGCSDLIAFESFASLQNKPFSYIGIDLNTLWQPVHNFISAKINNSNIRFAYCDAVSYCTEHKANVNVLVMNYIISSICRNDPKDAESFLQNVCTMLTSPNLQRPFTVVINDVNHCNAGRDIINKFANNISQYPNVCVNRFYFPYQSPIYCYGNPTPNWCLCYQLPPNLDRNFYAVRDFCTSAQTLIELY